MKHIKIYNSFKTSNILNERLGVPEGNIETSKDVYGLILKKLEMIKNRGTIIISKTQIPTLRFSLDGVFRISDYNFHNVLLNIKFLPYTSIDLASMSFGKNSRINKETYRTEVSISDNVNLEIELAIGINSTFDDLYNFFISNKNQIISSLAHEFKHAYDSTKKGESIASVSDYQSFGAFRMGIRTVDEFLHYLYFIHNTENLVRPTEVASYMDSMGITKEKFLEFLTNSDVYKMLKKINMLTFEDLRNSLKKEKHIIIKRFEANDIEIPESDDELVDKALKLLYMNLVSTKGDIMFRILEEHPIENILGLQGTKREFHKNYLKDAAKYGDNWKMFYEKELNLFHKISNKMLKKISKLYDLAKDNSNTEEIIDQVIKSDQIPETSESSSIYNWEAYYKGRGIKPKIKNL